MLIELLRIEGFRGFDELEIPRLGQVNLIVGQNGVGKTTYAMRHLKAVSGSINFVNMDEIARGLR